MINHDCEVWKCESNILVSLCVQITCLENEVDVVAQGTVGLDGLENVWVIFHQIISSSVSHFVVPDLFSSVSPETMGIHTRSSLSSLFWHDDSI